MRSWLLTFAFAGTCALVAPGCDDGTGSEPSPTATASEAREGSSKADASVEAVFLDLHFDATVLASSCFNPSQRIEDQLLFTIGQLNGERSVGRLDQLALTNVTTTSVEGGCELSYSARLPVAWGIRDKVPETYTFVLPRSVTYAAAEAFATKYSHDCVDWGAHDVDSGSMWYYYRPKRCTLDDADVHRVVARVEPSPIATTGKYPEYHKVWEDGRLEVVAVFGKYEDDGADADAGVQAYNRFLTDVGATLKGAEVSTTPAELPANPGTKVPEVVFEARLANGDFVQINALLVDNVRTAGAAFDGRYEELSATADIIVYNGHAGLGANIRALANKGSWKTGQYVIVFMNGCDTYAYVDDALAKAHMAVNEDDETGSKYVDIVTNAMPSFFRDMDDATTALVEGLMAREKPRTYEQIFQEIDSSQVVLVSGEQDNVFFPGYGDDPGPSVEAWAGLDASGAARRDEEVAFETPRLPAGKYVVELSGDGDADLYVRVGVAPNVEEWDCRPYRIGSKETCEVDLAAPAPVHIMVRGWDDTSSFTLVAGVR